MIRKLKKLKKYLNPGTHRNLKMEESKEATFRLMLDEIEVGRLMYANGKWVFNYSEEFKETQGIKTLAGFPDINKTYVSEELWPFFSSRIPSLSRNTVKNVIEKEGIKENDLLALLTRFGKSTITNPFKLLSVD